MKGGLTTGNGSFKTKSNLAILKRKRSTKQLLMSSIFVKEQKPSKLYWPIRPSLKISRRKKLGPEWLSLSNSALRKRESQEHSLRELLKSNFQ